MSQLLYMLVLLAHKHLHLDFQAGEAIGKWQSEQPIQDEATIDGQLPNALELPFRRQPAPGKKNSA